ncbi:MAG: hypothetical protein Q8Q41_02550 [bacterium]|nr:hypothetical protein [bacterium]
MVVNQADKNKLYQIIKSTPAFNRLGPVENPSGVRDPFIVEIAPLLSDPGKAKAIGKIFGKVARQLDVELVAGIATSAVSLAATISLMSDIPFVYVRKERDRKTGQIIEGDFRKGAKTLLIDDMIGDGGEKERVVKEVGNDLKIKNILVLWESHEAEYFNWPKRMRGLGLNVISFFNWLELVKALHRDGALSGEATEIFDDWLHSIGKWSENEAYWAKFEYYRRKYRLRKGDSMV